jgi:hypothetical protein
MPAGADPTEEPCANETYADLAAQQDHAREVAAGIHEELGRMFTPEEDGEPVFDYMPITHSNFWRIPDGRPPGLDGWSELHYNYVVFSADSNLEEGGQAEGAFSLVLDADISSTRLFIKGNFQIDKIKKDRWKTDDLQAEKLIENGATLCQAASEQDADPSKGD